jgi:cell wall-associated NlpC family hydrolase
VNGIVDLAKKYLGTPYSWGGGGKSGPSKGFGRGANTVGFDCSSFIQFLYAKYGVDIPRVTYDQVKVGQKIDRQNLQPGDAVFFAHGGDVGHVGMYIGNGKFIHAPRTGDVIKISSLDDSYYSQHFYGGRRYG